MCTRIWNVCVRVYVRIWPRVQRENFHLINFLLGPMYVCVCVLGACLSRVLACLRACVRICRCVLGQSEHARCHKRN